MRDLWLMVLVVCVGASTVVCYAQSETDAESLEIQADSTSLNVDDQPLKSPRGAMLRSMILPGWGQWYNEQHVKSAAMFAVNAVLAYGIVDYHRRWQEFEDETDPAQRTQDEAERLRLRDRRDDFAWFFGLAYIFTFTDAYVNAYLFGFDETVRISAVPLTPEQRGVAMQVRIKF